MAELFRQIDIGARSLSELYVLSDADKAPGSGVMTHLHSGMQFTIADLAYLMMSISDNTATNVFIEMLGMPAIGATMQRLAMSNSTIGRKMLGRKAQGDEKENWATPRDYAGAIEVILEKRAASTTSCDAMIALLEKQQNDRRIARCLPKASRPRWGSKTGSVEGVCNDVGFVMSESGPVILSVFCENPPDQHSGEAIIGDISRAALEAVAGTAGLEVSS
jgi:beta-lactamase class A